MLSIFPSWIKVKSCTGVGEFVSTSASAVETTASTEPATAVEAAESASESTESTAGHVEILRSHHSAVVHLFLSFEVLTLCLVVDRMPGAGLPLLPAALAVPAKDISVAVGDNPFVAIPVENALPSPIDIVVVKVIVTGKIGRAHV